MRWPARAVRDTWVVSLGRDELLLMQQSPVIALVQPADQPPDRMLAAARAADEADLEEMWLWEDCFAASGIAPAAAILSATASMRVGIGLMPTLLRVPSLTAMEIATVAEMFPGRFLPGLGHGVQDWMAQIGARVASPLTLLREQLSAIGPLLQGEEVTTSGRYVTLDRVQLRFPPAVVPPLLVGGRGPKTLAVAGALADGVILDDAAPGGQGRCDAGDRSGRRRGGRPRGGRACGRSRRGRLPAHGR